MFVRWKNRTLAKKNGSGPAERSLYAVIVKNQRVEGRTKQKVVKYLAHISERHLHDAQHQGHFWERVDQALDELDLSADLRAEIETKLTGVVARPPRQESRSPRPVDTANEVASFRRVHIGSGVGVE